MVAGQAADAKTTMTTVIPCTTGHRIAEVGVRGDHVEVAYRHVVAWLLDEDDDGGDDDILIPMVASVSCCAERAPGTAVLVEPGEDLSPEAARQIAGEQD